MQSNTISISKGIGIFLMVIGHSGCPVYLNNYIYIFHMPLFFFISGYCFKDKYLNDFKTYWLRRIKNLYYPLVKYELIFLLLHNFFCYIHIYDQASTLSLQDTALKAINILTAMYTPEAMLGGFWFIRELFYASFIFYFIRRFGSINIWTILMVITTIILKYTDIHVPYWGMNYKTFLATIFLTLGYYSSERFKIEKYFEKNKYLIISFICVAIYAYFFPHTMDNVSYIHIIPYLLFGFAGIYATMATSHLINKHSNVSNKKLWVFAGNNSFTILTWHFLSFKLISLLIIYIYNQDNNKLSQFPIIKEEALKGWWIFYAAIGFSAPLIIAYFEQKRKHD